MKRWSWILLGLGAAAGLLWAVAGRPGRAPEPATAPPAEIDEASRRALERVLEEAERREAPPP